MSRVHTAFAPRTSCLNVSASELFSAKEAATTSPYSEMSYDEVLWAIEDHDTNEGDVSLDMLRERVVLEILKESFFDEILERIR